MVPNKQRWGGSSSRWMKSDESVTPNSSGQVDNLQCDTLYPFSGLKLA